MFLIIGKIESDSPILDALNQINFPSGRFFEKKPNFSITLFFDSFFLINLKQKKIMIGNEKINVNNL